MSDVKARIAVAALTAWCLLPSGLEAQPAARTMTVFVVSADIPSVKSVNEKDTKAILAAISVAEKERRTLEKTLKAAHGNKRESWPQHKRDAFADADEAVRLAQARWDYRLVDPTALADSARALALALRGEAMTRRKEHVVVVPSREQAQLIVEVDGRRSVMQSSTLTPMQDDERRQVEAQYKAHPRDRPDDYYFWITLTIKAGPQLTPERLRAIPREYRFKRRGYDSSPLHSPRMDSPWWQFETVGILSWTGPTVTAAMLVDDLIAEHYAALAD